MRGLGPFVINTLSMSGAMRLETLEGDQMTNFINGSRIKTYEEPLTQDMLMRLCTAKKRKDALAQIKKEAQEEAKQRVERAKLRRKQLRVGAIYADNPQELFRFIEPFCIETTLVSNRASITILVFIDSGSVTTMMSYDTWVEIGQPELVPTDFTITSFNNTTTQCLGTCYVKLRIQDEHMYELFYVADKHQAVERIVLGRYWMWSTKCHLDWELRQYTIQVNSVTLTVPSAQEISTETIRAP